MSQLPSYFEHCREADESSGLYPFAYDRQLKMFLAGDLPIDLHDFDPYQFNPHRLNIENDDIAVDEMSNNSLYLNQIGHLIAGPALHAWTAKNPVALKDTRTIMHQALTSFLDDESAQEISDSEGGHMGFAAGLREDGGIHLQVLGNCACMGPDPQALFIDNRFEHGYAQYDLHNADSQMQRASLYAGLGHLAFSAEDRQSSQGQLF